ncbi:hypothetical protein GBA52_025308 [Prunus armeniaca]|nr:hypothetical protein GBA52_025308 [Prunus armeniaca]
MAIDEDVESCGSRAALSSHAQPRYQRDKLEVYNEVLRRIQQSNFEEANLPGFDDQLWLHFNRLPPRYALDVNVERAEDVLTHKRLLQFAEDPANQPAFEVRTVQTRVWHDISAVLSILVLHSITSLCCFVCLSYMCNSLNSAVIRIHPPPTFGSSPNLEAFALQANRYHVEDGGSAMSSTPFFSRLLLNGFENSHLFTVEQSWSKQHPIAAIGEDNQTRNESFPDCIEIPTDGTDVWEIDTRQLKFENKVGSGSFGDLYRGTYCSQEVAIKVLKPDSVVKVADFGVARVQTQSGVMTAETGTYRWMAPEVIEHKPYAHKADVFSFGIVLWELLTGQLPYSSLTPLQAAVGVVQKALRPTIPKTTHPRLAELLERCWQQDPTHRPPLLQYCRNPCRIWPRRSELREKIDARINQVVFSRDCDGAITEHQKDKRNLILYVDHFHCTYLPALYRLCQAITQFLLKFVLVFSGGLLFIDSVFLCLIRPTG